MSGFSLGCGVVIEWFELFGGYTDPAIIPEMERDRLDFAAQPGFIRKLLVVGDAAGGGDLGGGIYFLRDLDKAKAFLHWATEEHRDPDGHTFEEREYVGESEGYVGELIGHYGPDYDADIAGAVRIQQFSRGTASRAELQQKWQDISGTLGSSGLLGASLVLDEDADMVFVILVSAIRSAHDSLDRRAFDELNAAGIASEAVATDAVEDILLWVHTVWEGYEPGTAARDAQWPNSPPLPHAPYWNA